jgi:4,5-DOPA dioxygenase extradiol
MEKPMSVVFIGHGNPMNALQDNPYTRGWALIGREVPRPKAVLSVSAHWYIPGTSVTSMPAPRTIHDFGGFPPELYRIRYPAPGDPALADRVRDLLAPMPVTRDWSWGLDHGTWTVLRHVFPRADVPVVQLSMDQRMPVADHLEIGRKLAPLRDEGVLIFGSGNITHNLRHAMASYQRGESSTPDWATRFDADIARSTEKHETDLLIRAVASGDGRMAHPTLDHYLPLLYAAGASGSVGPVRFPITGFDLSSLSMRAIVFG